MLKSVPTLLLLLALVASWGWAPARCETAVQPAPEVVTLGAPLSAPSSIDVDQYGRIYVLDRFREAVMRFSSYGELERLFPENSGNGQPNNSRIEMRVSDEGVIFLGWGGTGCQEPRRIWPSAQDDRTFPIKDMGVLCVAGFSDGSFYVRGLPWGKEMKPDADTIRAYSPDGVETARWSTPCMGNWTIGNDGLIYGALTKPRSVRSKGGALPEPQPGQYSAILAYTTDGKLHHKVDISALTGGNPLVWSAATRFAVDTNGDVYAGDGSGFSRLASDGRLIKRCSVYSGQLQDTIVRDGLVYALVKTTDSGATAQHNDGDFSYEIQVYTPDGECVTRYVPPRPPLDLPAQLAIQPDGSYAALDHGFEHTVLYDSGGSRLGSPPGLYAVKSVVAIPGGRYCIASWAPDGIGLNIVEADGKTVKAAYRAPGWKDTEMPFKLTADPRNGDLWGLNRFALFHFSPEGRLIERREAAGNWVLGKLCPLLTGFAMDRKGLFYVSDIWRHCVVKLDIAGNEIARFGKEGTGLGELRAPQGIVVDAKGNVFVADSGNSRIHVFAPDGKALGFWGHRGAGSGELDRPVSVSFGPNHTLWIADTHNDRIVRVPLEDFWKQLEQQYKPEPAIVEAKPRQLPAAGKVSIAGTVVAGSDDFTDIVYIESPGRAWGVSVALPKGKYAMRGQECRVSGTMDSAKRHLAAETVEPMGDGEPPAPLGMSNLYVGNGYRKATGLTNECMLVRTWGRVISVDSRNLSFTISDGSNGGILVSAQSLVKGLSTWPRIGQYVGVTGVSVTSGAGASVRIRGREDIQAMLER